MRKGIIVILMAIMGAVAFSFLQEKPEGWATVDHVNFYLKDETTNSTFSGTVFAQVKGDEKRAILAGWVNITEKDFGGAAVFVPPGWEVLEAFTSYSAPISADPSNWIAVLGRDGGREGYSIWIGPAGYDLVECGHNICGGGAGGVFIELRPTEDGTNLTLNLAVGSRVISTSQGSVKAIFSTSSNVTVSFKK